MSKQTDLINVTDAITVDGSNLVGIGTSSPSVSKLHLNYNSVNNRGIRLQDQHGTYDLITSGSGNNNSFGIYNDTQGAYRLFIDSAGNVGIGTSSPKGNGVHIVPNGGDTALFLSSSSGDTNTDEVNISTLNKNNTGWQPLNIKAYQTKFWSNGSEAMRIDSSGNLLVGTTSDNVANQTGTAQGVRIAGANNIQVASTGVAAYFNKLSTDGDIVEFRKSGTKVGSISVTSSGATYNTTSDRRLKDNIEPIADGTEKLMAMKPVTHTWIANPEADAVHGFIAQEMQEIVPEAVSGDPEGEEMMSMDYGRITPVLVAALQEATNEIKALKERVAELENK